MAVAAPVMVPSQLEVVCGGSGASGTRGSEGDRDGDVEMPGLLYIINRC